MLAHTGTVAEAAPRKEGTARGYVLHLALCGDNPLAGGHTFDLRDARDVTIGRGAPLAIAPGTAAESARIDIPDSTMSGKHARLVLDDARVVIEDLGSRNGTKVRGDERTPRATLVPGDWFVLGRSVFMFARAADLTSEDLEGSGLRTFDPALAETYRKVAALAPSEVPLLLLAETGTGKEVLAREIHRLSGRAGRLVAVNCAALPENLVESELFGYRRGAFSEAREDRPGLVRAADGGTLLFDEVGDLPLPSQAKLLRVLQEGEVLALGTTAPVKVNVRIIAATQRPLDALVSQGAFRADLLGRLAGYTLSLPPLRARLSDLGLLVSTLLERHGGGDAGRLKLTSEACVALFRRRWPLNVRELERTIQAAVVLARAYGEITPEHLGVEPSTGGTLAPTTSAANDAELRAQLVESLRRHAGNVSAVARDFGKARQQIHRWMERFALDPESFRS